MNIIELRMFKTILLLEELIRLFVEQNNLPARLTQKS